MVIATFAPTTGWAGRTITFDNEVLTVTCFPPDKEVRSLS